MLNIWKNILKLSIFLWLSVFILYNNAFSEIINSSESKNIQQSVAPGPGILMSSEQGDKWHAITDYKLPDDYGSGELNSIMCNGKTCIAAGSYSLSFKDKNKTSLKLEGGHFSTLILNSIDGGLSWVGLNKDKIIDPASRGQRWISSVACNKSFCVIAGSYNNYAPSSAYLPYILIKPTNSDTWTLVDQANIRFPIDFKEAGMNLTARCNDQACLLAGTYQSIDNITKPMILISIDGSHWEAINLTNLHLPDGIALTGLHCSGMSCSALGKQTQNSQISHVIVLNSLDYGKNWSAVFPNITTTYTTGNLFCSVMGCIGLNNDENVPNILTSNVERTIWETVPKENIIWPSSCISSTKYLYSVSCSLNTCVTVGDACGSKPLLLVNTNQGIWRGVESNSIDIPNNTSLYCDEVAYNGGNFICAGSSYNNSPRN